MLTQRRRLVTLLETCPGSASCEYPNLKLGHTVFPYVIASRLEFWQKDELSVHLCTMKKEPKKSTEVELLDLLKKVLPKATHDPELAGKIYEAVELELKAKAQVAAFEKLCSKIELPDLEAKSIGEVKTQLAVSFGQADITLQPNRKEKTMAVEVALSDGRQLIGEIKVNPDLTRPISDEEEATPKLVPFPVCLPGDKELVWLLGKRENISPAEAGIALTKVEEGFWASKGGQKLLRDRVERSFAEFIARVPGGMLGEVGLKRHYKTPEAVKLLRNGKPK